MSPSFYKNHGSRSILVYATSPTGLKLAQGLNSNNKLIDCGNLEIEHLLETGKPDSIIIITSPGDGLAGISKVHDYALVLNVLITTIVIFNSCCRPPENTRQLEELRNVSDMLVLTFDENYFAYALECLG